MNFLKGNLSTSEFLISFLVPFSQIYFRMVKLDGSLDKPWLLFPLFLIFPLSILPTFYIHWNWLQKGQGGKPYDNWMYIPIILHVILMLILNRTKPSLELIIKLASITVGIMVPYFIREYNNCNQMGLNQMANVLGNSILIMGIAELLPSLFSILSFVPFVGMFFTLLGLIKSIPVFGETLFWSLGYLLSYVILNAINGKDIQKYCGNNKLLTFGFAGLGMGVLGFFLANFGFSRKKKVIEDDEEDYEVEDDEAQDYEEDYKEDYEEEDEEED